MKKKSILLTLYYTPMGIAIIRIIMTIVVLTLPWQENEFRLKFIQIIPIVVLLSSCFRMYRLYVDAVPVVSLLLPTLLQFIISFILYKTVPIRQLIFLLIMDIFFLIAKVYKSGEIPFTMDGEEEDDFSDIIDE